MLANIVFVAEVLAEVVLVAVELAAVFADTADGVRANVKNCAILATCCFGGTLYLSIPLYIDSTGTPLIIPNTTVNLLDNDPAGSRHIPLLDEKRLALQQVKSHAMTFKL